MFFVLLLFISLLSSTTFRASLSLAELQREVIENKKDMGKDFVLTLLRDCINSCSRTSEDPWIYTNEEFRNIREDITKTSYKTEKGKVTIKTDESDTPLWMQYMVTDGYKKIVFLGGDLHGHLEEFLLMIKPYVNDDFSFKEDYRNCLFVTIGDYVDKGKYSVELVATLAKLKTVNGKQFMMHRGNHDTIELNTKDTEVDESDLCARSFKQNIQKKFNDDDAWNEFVPVLRQFYATMPIASWIGRRYIRKVGTFSKIASFIPFVRHVLQKGYDIIGWTAINHASALPFDGEDSNILASFEYVVDQEKDTFYYKILGNEDNQVRSQIGENEYRWNKGSVNDFTNDLDDHGLSYFWAYFNLEESIFKYLKKEQRDKVMEELEKRVDNGKKIEYLNEIKEQLVKDTKQYNTISPHEMQNRAQLISNEYHEVREIVGGHQHSSSSEKKQDLQQDQEDDEIHQMIDRPFKQREEEHKKYGWSLAPWRFNIFEDLFGHSVILAPPFLEDQPTEESVKKYVKTLDLETGQYEDELPEIAEDAINIYPDEQRSYTYDITVTLALSALIFGCYKKTVIRDILKQWENKKLMKQCISLLMAITYFTQQN